MYSFSHALYIAYTLCDYIIEVTGQAARTELYLCSSCNATTRFPRYNDVTRVLNTRQGRCGEYSMLMMRLLQALGYSARWTADKADHVWTEVYLPSSATTTSSSSSATNNANSTSSDGEGDKGSWIHVDPCEAAIDEPYIYQSWGKNQTYIFSYSVGQDTGEAEALDIHTESSFAEDVTHRYIHVYICRYTATPLHAHVYLRAYVCIYIVGILRT